MNIMDKLDLNAFTEFSNSVAKKYNISEEEADDFVLKLGPKKLKRLGIFEASQGWREDLTKSSVEKRKNKRRKKNKQARKARRGNK